jgi:RecB family exonuclease
MPRGLDVVMAGAAVSELSADVRRHLDGDGQSRSLEAPLARTFGELRMRGVAPAQYRAFHADSSPRQQAKARAYVQYCALLDAHDVADDATLLREATARIRSEGLPDGRVIAVLDTVPLPACAFQFVQALRQAVEAADDAAFYRIGKRHCGAQTPADRAAVRLSEAGLPGSPSATAVRSRTGWAGRGAEPGSPEGPTDVRFWTATGAEAEVEAVLEHVLAEGLTLDSVEIAYTTPDPYLTVLDVACRRYDVPATLSTGRPAAATHTGQALLGFYAWIAGGLEAADLIRMLRGGLLRLDRVLAEEELLDPSDAATLLAEQRYASGRDGYRAALNRRLKKVKKELHDRREHGASTEHLERQRDRIQALQKVLRTLFDRVPRGPVSVAEMARHSARFLIAFCPVDEPPPDTPEDEQTANEVARGVLIDQMQALADTPDLGTRPRAQAVRQLRRLVESEYVKARRPQPGHAHVVPIEGAGYTDRAHLFVVGLDAESTSATVAEDPLLTDAERERLEADIGRVLPRQRAAGDRDAWILRRALGRHTGPLVLSTRTFDVQDGEEVAPSSLYLRLRERALRERSDVEDDDATENLADRTRALCPLPALPMLSDEMAWRAAYRHRRGGSTPELAPGRPGLPLVEADIASVYPWIAAGQHAEAQRQSDAYTAYDGLLASGPYPELDILDPSYRDRLSASRLQMLASAPYAYFLKYVLGVRPLDEPALDDVLWIDRLRRGTVLHNTFETFMQTLDEPVSMEHEDILLKVLDDELAEVQKEIEPPSEAVAQAVRRRLAADARVFLRGEAAYARGETDYEAIPRHFELGFGFEDHRKNDDDLDPVTLSFEPDLEVRLRGRIDRVDVTDDGRYVLWDYKTGSRSPYEGDDAPLHKGERLQWALYAYALESLLDAEVDASGYVFTSTGELGARIAHVPSEYRDEVAQLLQRLSAMSRAGCFPMNPDATPWIFGDYERICPDPRARKKELDAKTYPDHRPRPPHLD